jgi:hypothetical protein
MRRLAYLFHPLCGQPGLLLRVADPVSRNGFLDGLLGVGRLHVADQAGHTAADSYVFTLWLRKYDRRPPRPLPQEAGGAGEKVGIPNDELTPEDGYLLPPPPKNPLPSRKICERMNGSGSAPMTMVPELLHPFQQTTYSRGVYWGHLVTPLPVNWSL